MSNEYPPKDEQGNLIHEEVEAFSAETPVNIELAQEIQKEQEKTERILHEQEQRSQTKREIIQSLSTPTDTDESEGSFAQTTQGNTTFVVTPRSAFTNETKSSSSWYNNARRSIVAGLASLMMLGGAKAATTEKDSIEGDKKGKKIEAHTTVNQNKKTGLNFYTGGTEKTPTGKDNSFNKNEAGLSEEQILDMAKTFQLSTESNESFQKSLLAKYPEQVAAVMERYGQTNAGTFLDGILGARVKEVLDEITKKESTPLINIVPEAPQKMETLQDFLAGHRGEVLYNQSGTAEAVMRYAIRPTEPGAVEMMFIDRMGKPTGEMYQIPNDVYSNEVTHGKNRIMKKDGLEKYIIQKTNKDTNGYIESLATIRN